MDLVKYADSYNEVFNLLETLSCEQINFKPAEDKWSIHEIITHLADTEVQSHVRFRTILANKNPFMVYHDEMNWSVMLDYTKIDFNESISVIKLMRGVNYNLLIRVPDENFDKKGIHSTRGEISLRELVDGYTRHVERHLEQIKRNYREWREKKCIYIS